LLGLAVRRGALFCTEDDCVAAIKQLAPKAYVDQNLQAFSRGFQG